MVKLRVCPLFRGVVVHSRSQLAGKRLGWSGSKKTGRPNIVSVPLFAYLHRRRPNSVSVPIFGPVQIIQYDTSKAAPWSPHRPLPEKQILTN